MYGKEYNDWENFGIRLKNKRNSIGMTIEKLAEKTNRTENYISRIESGKKRCSIDTLYLLCNALNTTADSLLFGEKEDLKQYSDKDVILNIINKCDKHELELIKDVLISINKKF